MRTPGAPGRAPATRHAAERAWVAAAFSGYSHGGPSASSAPPPPPGPSSVLSRSVVLNMLGRFGNLAVGFATSIMLADWLGASDRGLLGVVLTASNVAYVLAGFGLPLAVAYYSSRHDVDDGAMFADT